MHQAVDSPISDRHIRFTDLWARICFRRRIGVIVLMTIFAGMTMSDLAAEVLALNQKLLNSIVSGDWATYTQLCDPAITCIEPEARGQIVTGLPFHKYYFPEAPVANCKKNVTMCSVNARVVGDVAVLAYIRLTQYVDANGAAQTGAAEETRIWERKAGAWKHVHFHRSPLA